MQRHAVQNLSSRCMGTQMSSLWEEWVFTGQLIAGFILPAVFPPYSSTCFQAGACRNARRKSIGLSPCCCWILSVSLQDDIHVGSLQGWEPLCQNQDGNQRVYLLLLWSKGVLDITLCLPSLLALFHCSLLQVDHS